MFKLFWVTDRTLCPGDFLSRLEAIAKARPDGIILREKDLAPEDYRALAAEVMAAAGSGPGRVDRAARSMKAAAEESKGKGRRKNGKK